MVNSLNTLGELRKAVLQCKNDEECFKEYNEIRILLGRGDENAKIMFIA